MNDKDLIKLLEEYKNSQLSHDEALKVLRNLPFEDIEFARIDHHREIRKGFPEVIFGMGKSNDQIVEIIRRLNQTSSNILITRSNEEVYNRLKTEFADVEFRNQCKAIVIRKTLELTGKGKILIISAGTADIPIAEEAMVTADIFGNETEALYDVGVAGVHRLLAERERITSARVIIVVAGMEGALPSVVAGLTAAPVIGVPTSIGYGSHFSGLTPLLSMLNSCAGLAVVNIDNGFGAAQFASIINHL
jgi:pyridinium-3,5-biscarboxylic acid mononucleotide synthase